MQLENWKKKIVNTIQGNQIEEETNWFGDAGEQNDDLLSTNGKMRILQFIMFTIKDMIWKNLS